MTRETAVKHTPGPWRGASREKIHALEHINAELLGELKNAVAAADILCIDLRRMADEALGNIGASSIFAAMRHADEVLRRIRALDSPARAAIARAEGSEP